MRTQEYKNNFTGYKCSRCHKKIYGDLSIMPWTGILYCKLCKKAVRLQEGEYLLYEKA